MSAARENAAEHRIECDPKSDTILSVDSDEKARTTRRRILQDAGFRVVDAADSADALELADAESPALILLSGRRSATDGPDFCARLMNNPRTAAIPVVHLSAPERPGAPDSRCGRSHLWLREPLAPETLLAVVGALGRARQAEREALDAGEKYRNVLETAHEAIWCFGPDGAIRSVNRRMAEMLQYPPEELVGMRVWDLAPEGDREQLKALLSERFAADASDRVDLSLRRRDGSILWLSASGKNTYEHGVAAHRTGVFVDITERKRVQDALAEERERLELALDAAELGTWEADVATGVITASPLTCAMFDLESARPRVDEWLVCLHPEDRGRVRVAFERAMAGGSYDVQFRVVGGDGSTRWIHSKARRVRDSRGVATRLVGVAQDVSRDVQAGEFRERQRELFQAIIENIPVMLCLYDPMLRSFHLNRECERVLGWTTEEVNTHDFLTLVYPDPVSRGKAAAYMQSLRPGWREFDCVSKSGDSVPCEWANIRLSDDRLLGIGIDLRDRKRAEESVREGESKLRAQAAELQAIMDALPVAVFVARDAECRDVIGSRMTYELLRLREGSNVSLASEAPGNCGFRFARDGDEIPERQLPAQRAAATGEPVRDYEFDIVFSDGATRNMLGHAVPLFDEDSRPAGAVAAFLDITDRKRAEKRLLESQKLESLGVLAGGIAHDFNNLLTAIMGNTSIVMEEVGPEPAKRLRGIMSSAQRAANLIRQLLAYSGKGGVLIREVDVAQSVSEMRGLMELSVPKSVTLHLDLEQRLPSVKLDPSQLEQVLMNLVINAGEAIGEGNPGRIGVSASLAIVAEPFTDALGSEIATGRFVRIEVSDTGGGIDPETMRKLFDPFFTTKFSGRGLGLAAVAGIVRSHRGAITVESALQKGTIFRVLLPVGAAVIDGGEGPQDNRAAVLVVDDDEAVREFIAEVARRRGFRAATACDGPEALEFCERGRVDAVVLDIVMPVMGANALLPEVKRRQPNARVLLTSGYSEMEARRLCAAYPDTMFVQKPYTAEQIGDAIAELLGARKS